jgi:YVTN family beta-propeller protein
MNYRKQKGEVEMNNIVGLLLGLSLVMIVVLSAVNSVHALEVIATVPVGTGPWGVAYDSGTGEVYVANHYDNTVSVISDSNNTVVATVPVGIEPVGVAYDSGTVEIYVTNNGAGTVSVISDSTHTVIATIPIGTNPVGVAYDSGKGEIYVANWGSNTVSVISDRTHTVITTVTVGDRPKGVAYDSGNGKIYVANSDSSGNGTVSVISESTHTVIATVTVGNGPNNLAYDSDESKIFVDCGSAIYVISDSANTVIATVRIGAVGIAYDLGKGVIFCSGSDGHNVTVWIMSDYTYDIVANLTLGQGSSYDVVYDSATGEVFVPDGRSSVYVISYSSIIPEFPSMTPLLIMLVAVVAVTVLYRRRLHKQNQRREEK